MSDERDKPYVPERPTVQLDKSTVPPLQLALAALERMGPDAIWAFRLGVLVRLQHVTRQMTLPGAKASLVVEARELIELLARLPWEP